MSSLDRDFLRKSFNQLEEKLSRSAEHNYLDTSYQELKLQILIAIGRAILSKETVEPEIVELHPPGCF